MADVVGGARGSFGLAAHAQEFSNSVREAGEEPSPGPARRVRLVVVEGGPGRSGAPPRPAAARGPGGGEVELQGDPKVVALHEPVPGVYDAAGDARSLKDPCPPNLVKMPYGDEDVVDGAGIEVRLGGR